MTFRADYRKKHRCEQSMPGKPSPPDPAALMESAHANGLEGIVAKKRTSLYEDGERSGSYLAYRKQ